MDGKTLARIGAVVFVAVAITATVIELTRKEEAPATAATQSSPNADPLRAMLRRCRDMGEAAMRDPVCLRVWAENRDRFLGQGTTPQPSPASPPPTEDPVRKESAPTDDAAAQPEPAQPEVR
jgi:conjugative transfer region protein TrbK